MSLNIVYVVKSVSLKHKQDMH